MRTLVSVAAVGLSTAMPALAADIKQVVRVYVTGEMTPQKSIPEAEWTELSKQLTEEMRAAEEAADRLEKAIKAEHGKKREAWPSDKRAQLEKFEIASGQAKTKLLYPVLTRKIVDGLVWDLTKTLDKKKHLSMVNNPDEADVVVTFVGLRAPEGLKVAVCFEVASGPRLDKKVLAGQKIEWPSGSGRKFGLGAAGGLPGEITRFEVLHPYVESEPFWRVEVTAIGAGQQWAATTAADVLDMFANSNSKALDASRTDATSR